jgi:hypothetical protein
MKRRDSTKRELSKRGERPSTYRRVVTANVSGKSVVQSDEPLPAYEFKTVPGYEHTLIWVNPAIPYLREAQGFDLSLAKIQNAFEMNSMRTDL